MQDSLKHAIKNIANFGDTDIFPFPLENALFHDCPEEILSILERIHSHFDDELTAYPPTHLSSLAPAGYTGFRWATQLDPVWNAYLLALAVELGDAIEAKRISTTADTVFSYRFERDNETGAIFTSDLGWPQFREKSLEHARNYQYVLIADISEFYTRIYHHRLENALSQIDPTSHLYTRILKLLTGFTQHNSYGLPIGGPAARLLSEALLNRTDRLFRAEGLTFCRFADDYHFFSNSKEHAYQILVTLSEKLYVNEGLSLQKSKTRIMPSSEFISTTKMLGEHEEDEQRAGLLRMSLRFDPYSADPEGDYEELRELIGRYDILGLLTSELSKTRVHSPTTKQLLRAIRFLPNHAKDSAAVSLIENIETLAPLFGVVCITLKALYSDLNEGTRDLIHENICDLVRSGSYITKIEMNIAYAVRLLSMQHSEEAEALLTQIYAGVQSQFVRKEVILAMTRLRITHWLSERRRYFADMGPWERRAFIVGSYCLNDEGKFWRQNNKAGFTPLEQVIRRWASDRADNIRSGILPI